MKRITWILALGMCLSLVGCGQKPAETFPDEQTLPVPSAEVQTEAGETSVEITLENWEQYFELREAVDPYADGKGTVTDWSFCYGLFLREEYTERFVAAEVNFELQYDRELHTFSGSHESGAWELGSKTSDDMQGLTKTFALEDLRQDPALSELSDFYGSIAGRAYGGNISGDGEVLVPVNGQVLHAEGQLTLVG